MEMNEAVALRICALLEEKKMTKYRLCANGGIPRSTLYLILDRHNKSVQLDTLCQITSTLGITLKEFFDDPVFDKVTD